MLPGLCIGSFLNVCIHRLPLGESVVQPGARAARAAASALAWCDNIPVVSYVVLARPLPHAAGSPISLRYPIVEALTAAHLPWHYVVVRADAARLRPARCSPAR